MATKLWYEPSIIDSNRNNHFKPITFGSARFLGKKEALFLRLSEEGEGGKICPYIGTFIPENSIGSEHLHYADNSKSKIYARTPSNSNDDELQRCTGHIITFGSTRAGKGTGQIITNLLSWQGSVFVLDVKGENYLHSEGYRENKIGQNIFRFAPFEKYSNIWNPILYIRANLNRAEATHEERCQEEEDARYLANLIITSSGSKNDQFWEEKAKMLLVGLLIHIRTANLIENDDDIADPDKKHVLRERSMSELVRLNTLPPDDFLSLLGDMSESDTPQVQMVGNSFQGFLSDGGKLGQSIRSMLMKHLDVWGYERVHRVTYKLSTTKDDREPAINDFKFSQMRDGKTTFYLIIPPEYLSEYRSVLRVMIGCAIRELKDSFKLSKLDPDKPPVLFLLDEFAQLAYMKPIEEGLAYLAGYDVRLWFFLQDINQLKSNYPNSWESFFANTEFKCFFGVNDINTAKLVSEMAGTSTVENISNSNGTLVNTPNWSQEAQARNLTIATTMVSRSLMTPGEVLNLHANKQIIFIKSLSPMFLDLPKYYECPILKEKSEIQPSEEIDFL